MIPSAKLQFLHLRKQRIEPFAKPHYPELLSVHRQAAHSHTARAFYRGSHGNPYFLI